MPQNLTEDQKRQLRERMVKQMFFNTVVDKMRKQGKPGVHEGTAKLRADDGSRCSLGWLIADSCYTEELETLCPNAAMIDTLEMPKFDYQFYDDLQIAHDQSALRRSDWWENFAKEMRKVATKHFLDPSSLSGC